ncbi:glycosyltransferase family 4 protein [Granulosicoccaceae sp. 1_MG-2023]|nr:glycosyltransferase family 4 protein [Granulosicoccaceae sp. 1_MG-2023]
MHILFLSHYFPPEVNAPASRTFDHCKTWVKQGHQVTVVTCAPNHPRGKVYDGYKNRLYSSEEIDGIRVVRLWTYITANEGFVKRTLGYVSYMLATFFYLPFAPRADVVISTSPQFFNGLAGYAYKLLKRTPWVLEIRDLWPESILAVGAIKNKKIIGLLEWLERFAYRKADHIVPVTDAFRDYMLNLGVPAEKITVIKNGVDLSLYDDSSEADLSVLPDEVAALQGRFVAAYVGTHGMAHHLETILEAAELLRDEPGIVFLTVGEGAESARLRALRDEKGLDNVIMAGQLPKTAMPAIWAISDVSLVLLKDLPLFRTVIPSKIFESMAMGKPIILGVRGESQQIVESAGAGFAITPQSADELAEKLRLLYNDKDSYQRLAGSGRGFVQTHYDRSTLAQRLLSAIEGLVARGRTKRRSDSAL